MPQEQEEFLKEFEPKKEVDVLDAPLAPVEAKPAEEEPEKEDSEEVKNRRMRRLEAKLQAERESSIALAARLETLTEAQRFTRESAHEDDHLKRIERIYGTDSPEATAATELLKTTLQDVESRATERALAQLREEQEAARQAVATEEKSLEAMVDDLKDTYGVTFDKQTQQGFFILLEKLSPKDSDGNVIAYADHHAVWEELQSRRPKADNSRAKDLASRSMVKTGASPATSVEADSNERWLRENGII